MGCEDFVVRLSSEFTRETVTEVLLRMPHIHPDTAFPRMPDEAHFSYEDEQHIIEIEVAEGRLRTTISVRFAVCHPPTIDSVFAALVADLAAAVNADTLIAEDVAPDDPTLGWSFSQSQSANLHKALVQCIPKKRHLWQVEFGTVQARASCREAIDRFVIGASSPGR